MSTYQQRNTDAGDKVDNQTEGGRYGHAPDGQPHIEPEIAPVGAQGAEVNLPASFGGALPENAGHDDSPGKPLEGEDEG